MGSELIIVARTDSLSATLLDNNIDPVDHCVILGQTDPLNTDAVDTFPEAGRKAIIRNFTGADQAKKLNAWNEKAFDLSLKDAKQLAHKLGFDFYFDWDATRTSEGFYRIRSCPEYAIKRGRIFAEYADLLWCETPTPDLNYAKKFSDGIHAMHPHQMLAYNLSPSFNWDAAKMNDSDIEQFIPNLAKLGYSWQFCTLAGFHMDALISEVFARAFAKEGMLAYVSYIQRKEAEEGVKQLLHQKWSGVDIKDREITIVSKDASTKANQEGSTEVQFSKSKL